MGDSTEFDADVEAALSAVPVFAGVFTRSMAEVEAGITSTQLRALVLCSGQASMTLTALATELGVHPSNATRVVDRLVEARLLVRRRSASDRRRLDLGPTLRGRRLVERVQRSRRVQLRALLVRLTSEQRRALSQALEDLVRVAIEARLTTTP